MQPVPIPEGLDRYALQPSKESSSEGRKKMGMLHIASTNKVTARRKLLRKEKDLKRWMKVGYEGRVNQKVIHKVGR